jgi:poly-gamma-glutamate synthesis protein (capsule biosynthesis protein)
MEQMNAFDWKIGACEIAGAPKQNLTRVTVASDWGALWDYEALILDDPPAVYGDLLPLLREGDLNLVNVECALGEIGAPIRKGGPALRAPAQAVRSLVQAPFQVGCLANNHIMDFGPESLRETIGVLRGAGLQTVGAGMDGAEAREPLRLQIKNTPLAIVNCAEGEACASLQNGPGANPFDVEAIEKQVAALKAEGNAVLVIFHGGREYAPSPPPYVVNALRRFARAGACAVIAHHPHVPQGIEVYEGTPIAYSQGNFVFRWADTRNDNRYFNTVGYLAHLDFAGDTLARFSITPYKMKREGVFQLQGEERAHLLQRLERVSELLSTPGAVEAAWDAFGDSFGEAGLRNQLQSMLDRFDEDAPLVAAQLHNLFFCPAHRELYLNALKRRSNETLGDSPEWAKELVREWVAPRGEK